ncbi:UDP-N-acetylmuramoyl-tripeptide--D-alanyl-D-alanine ligase [Desulfofalx alkaliphila]|uniref:UDP-N-acetylmuramoyl-tripeptide--D-alanyl-D- alanine ligase n=1 Tax=Desulfofalx alkaliphila TaxID=105483 RepID=UPI0004E0D7FC|nr:UDP-N-acetylmuramoyl-tripeptide--D-alanyl-D-alanine ligase [Desulfofalx alkaliphila]
MKKVTIGEIVSAVKGDLLQGDPNRPVERVSTDTRSLLPGDIFFALVGANHDGHQYALQAVDKGAAALVLAKAIPGIDSRVPVIKVSDTLLALQALAAYNRRQFDIPVIAVTGSNGKTTTKDLIYSVLSQKYRVLKTRGNFNNEIGLPLTLLELNEEHDMAVLEMGMRGLGQIDELCKIAGINAGIITNIGETHLEVLGSIENIAQAKGEILQNVPPEGFGLIPAESQEALKQAGRCRGKVLTFGLDCVGDYVAVDVQTGRCGSSFVAVTPVGELLIKLPLPGRHNVSNAMAALAVGLKMGLSLNEVATGLAKAEISDMRLQVIHTGKFTIINDAYNANPQSTKAALTALADLAGERRQVAVLGNMYELGQREQQGHYEVGLAAKNVDMLVTVGQLAKYTAQGGRLSGIKPGNVYWFADNGSATDFLKKALKPHDVILVKGSRGMGMEEIVESIKDM